MPLDKVAIAYGAAGVTGSAVAPTSRRERAETMWPDPPGSETLLHPTTYDEVANIATFAAPDWARTITASETNITGGADINRPRTD